MDRIFCTEFVPAPTEFIKSKRGKQVASKYMCADTETSHNHNNENPASWIYLWAFSYNGKLVYGRTPAQFIDALDKIKKVNNLAAETTTDKGRQIVIYIHNLSYDYCYIKDFLREKYNEDADTMLAIGSHKLITFSIAGFIFKCSYRLSGSSLDSWCKDVGAKNKKHTGAIDYSEIIYQDSVLDNEHMEYMFADIESMNECLEIVMEEYHDNIFTIPYTATGYVRREARSNFNKDKSNRKRFRNTKLSSEVYMMCRAAFSGGITHGNRNFAGIKVEDIIRHRDFRSHYPSQQRCYTAPTTKFSKYYDAEFDKNTITIDELIKLANKYCLLIDIMFDGMEVKKGVTLPYAQDYKIYAGRCGKIDRISDNGRILKLSGKSIVTLTEIDLKWICKQYNFNYTVLKVYSSKKGEFPKYLQDTVDDYFIKKTKYKKEEKTFIKNGHSEESEEVVEAHRKLMLSKAGLNGIYGMSATDPVRDSFIENSNGEWSIEKVKEEKDITNALEDYYDSWNSFMEYQLGVWTTANARNELMEFVEIIGYDNFIYADTDSIFYISTADVEKRITERNALLLKISNFKKQYIETDGERINYNQFDDENEDIIQFKFLHAKCYAYVTADNELHAVIAGVRKKGRNNINRTAELGSIDELTDKKVFKECGGTQIKYVNSVPHSEIFIDKDGKEHFTELASSAIIYNVEKTLHGILSKDEFMFEWEEQNLCQ